MPIVTLKPTIYHLGLATVYAQTNIITTKLTVFHNYPRGIIDAESRHLVPIQAGEDYSLKDYVTAVLNEDHAVDELTARDLQVATGYSNLTVLEEMFLDAGINVNPLPLEDSKWTTQIKSTGDS